METGTMMQLIVLGIFLFLSSFFSASETALMSLSKLRIRHMVNEKVKGSELVYKLVNNPSKLLGVILVGNNVVNIGASALATSLAIEYFGSSGVGIATGVMTILVLIFGEITPKSLAAQNPEKVSLRVAKLISFITIILNPIVDVLIKITNAIIKLLGGKINIRQPFITEEELKTLINVGHEEGVLEVEEREIIHNVFAFGDLQAGDIMTPRADMIAVDVESTYEEIVEVFREHQFSRLPVYRENTDNIIGVLYLKDIFFCDSRSNCFDINDYMREPFITFEFKQLTELFDEMRDKRVPMAIVLDEYGGTAGIITMEDLVEEIVGEIEDEYDELGNGVEFIKENEYVVDGTIKIENINKLLGIFIESEDYDSIGGFVVGLFGRLPEEGGTLEYNKIRFIAEKIEKNRISRLRILTQE